MGSEVKINFAKPTVITQRKKNMIMNNYAGSTLIRPVVKPFSHINVRQSCLRGEGCLRYPSPYN